MNYFIYCWKNLFNYNGRARRQEYGWFILITAILSIGINLIEIVIFDNENINQITQQVNTTIVNNGQTIVLPSETRVYYQYKYSIDGYLFSAFWLCSLIPWIAVTTRRLHDINKSGWKQIIFLLTPFLPVLLNAVFSSKIAIAIIVIFALYCLFLSLALLFQDGEPEDNRFGKSPKIKIHE